jgi:DNA replication ATP-dependent helicase Dna2
MKSVPKLPHHVRPLLQGRNQLSLYLNGDASKRGKGDLPPMLQGKTQTCSRCYAKEKCLVYHRVLEQGTLETANKSGLQVDFEDKVGGLTESQVQFFAKWDRLIGLEEMEGLSHRRELWTLSSQEREKRKR